jgi:riboflavin biosynthesis pyrimidine reductase
MEGAVIAGIDNGHSGEEAAQVLRLLRARGFARVFVEGGGVTVSTFLQANLLDRLQIAIAPVLIGNGRPAIRLPPKNACAIAAGRATACFAWAATCCSTAS